MADDHEDYKVIADLTDHIADADAHHVRYTDAEARAAIANIFGSDGKADADIDLDGHDVKGGSVILPNGEYIGIGAALERLEFYTAGKAAFMGCDVGIGTDAPQGLLHVQGDSYFGHLDGSVLTTHYFYQGTAGTAGRRAHLQFNNDTFYMYNPYGRKVFATAHKESVCIGLEEDGPPWEAFNWWFDGSSSTGTGMWMHSPANAGSMNFQLGTLAALSKFNVTNSGLLSLFHVDGLGNVTVPLHDNATKGLWLSTRLVTYGALNSGGAGFRMLVVPN